MSICRAAVFTCGFSVLAACSSAPAGESASSLAQGLSNGMPSQHAVLTVSVAGGVLPTCSAVSLSAEWVLTSFVCGPRVEPLGAVEVCDTSSTPARCSAVSEARVAPQPAVYGTLLHLTTPIAMPSYPNVSRTPFGIGATMTCAGAGAHGPTEGPFEIDSAINATIGWWGALSESGAAVQWSDSGGGCYRGNTLVALIGKPDASVQDTSFLASWIDGVFCGSATCGTVVEGSETISCGSCGSNEICRSRVCAPVRTCTGNECQ